VKKAILLSVGWLLAAGSLYAGVLVLECYWNFANWRPRWDWESCSMLVWNAAALLGIHKLAQTSQHPLTRGVGLVLSLMLLSLGAWVLPAEPLSQGWLGREASSPFWYRSARSIIMALPLAFWGLAQFRALRQFDRAPS
jgi:hypothetical protein